GRLVKIRGELLDVLETHPELKPLDSDLRHLLIAWFNRGFLVMVRIDWNSSANVLEKIVNYEAVHEINGLDDLRTRLADDRRCFAFFHPAMPDDPLIFVQVALSNDVADSIGPLISGSREIGSAKDADTAIFYSISNCHDGLRGISFGNFLIKQVIEELRRDLENIKHLVTLSPVPGLCHWITTVSLEGMSERLEEDVFAAREMLTEDSESPPLDQFSDHAQAILMRLCAHYLLNAKLEGEPVDPVARFHLGNGAELERINWGADSSPAGRERSAGIMVNYVYRLKEIERNHERYFAEGEVVASSAVRKLAQSR
ncbi:MAG: malonyl-CoA decarboxylase domain-containing protein, partial [Gammaproteobacteria bacterium]